MQPHIVALSASEIDTNLRQKCKQVGFDDQFTSPLSASDI